MIEINSILSQPAYISFSSNSGGDAMILVTAFVVTALFSVIGLLGVVWMCRYFNIYDQPNARKVHHCPVPRLGGVVFMPAAILGVYTTLYLLGDTERRLEVGLSTLAMAAGALIVYIIGIFDDLYGIKAVHKFIIQGISALFLPLCGLLVTDLNGIMGLHEIPLWFSYPLTVLLIMTIVNAINLIDGIDGLASGLSILILSAYAYVFAHHGHMLIAILNIAFVGALVAFFFFNVFGRTGKLKIFMGDVGSLFLGYVCAYMSIKSLMRPIAPVDCGEEQMLISVTLLLIPVVDIMRVALQRLATGHHIFEPDKTHIHHLFMSAGLSMHGALAAIILFFFVICGMNYTLWSAHVNLTFILIVDVIVYALVVAILLNRIKHTTQG